MKWRLARLDSHQAHFEALDFRLRFGPTAVIGFVISQDQKRDVKHLELFAEEVEEAIILYIADISD